MSLVEESSVQLVSAPVTTCGDIHGQCNDLLELFEKGGQILDTRYSFMGDFVDRGYRSAETFQLLGCLALLHPDGTTLLRGDHEGTKTTGTYSYCDECTRKESATRVGH